MLIKCPFVIQIDLLRCPSAKKQRTHPCSPRPILQVLSAPLAQLSVPPWDLGGIEVCPKQSTARIPTQAPALHVLYMELFHLTGLQSPFSPVALVRLANVNHPSQFLEMGDLFSSPFPGATTSQTTPGWDITQLHPKSALYTP